MSRPTPRADAGTTRTTRRPATAARRASGAGTRRADAAPAGTRSRQATTDPQGRRGTPRRGSQASRRRAAAPGGRIAAVLIGVVALLLVVCLVDLASSRRRAVTGAQDTIEALAQVADALRTGEAEGLSDAVAQARGKASGLRRLTRSPSWWIGSLVPGVGRDLRVARGLADALKGVADDALAPLAEGTTAPLSGVLSDGSVSVAALRGLASLADEVAPALEACEERLADLPEARSKELSAVVTEARGALSSASGAVGALGELSPHLGSLLGQSGARTYLVVGLCESEVRSLGGAPRAWVPVTVDAGRLSVGEAVTIDLTRDARAELTDEERATFLNVADMIGGIAYLPSFERSAELMARTYERLMAEDSYGHYDDEGEWVEPDEVTVDGVVTMDVSLVQGLLSLVGGVKTDGGTEVDATNASYELLSGIPWRLGDADDANYVFAEVVGRALERTVASLGEVEVAELVSALERASAGGHLKVWVADASAQAALAAAGASGPTTGTAEDPVVGILLNDVAGSHMGWYLSLETEVSKGEGNADGSATYQVATRVSNTAWADELAYAPSSVVGYDTDGRSSTSVAMLLPVVVAPEGGSVSDMHVEGEGWTAAHVLYGRDAYTGVVQVAPGESVTLSFKVTTSADAERPLAVLQGPVARGEASSVTYDAD